MTSLFKRLFKKKDKKVVILGIDGAPYTLLKMFTEEGIMPNFARIMQQGTLCSMDASIPEVSSTSWTTFMTGVNPGKHNIFGFTEVQPNSYNFHFPNSNDVKSETMWDIMGKHGKKSIVINIPSTYPAKPLNGILTAGFVAHDLQEATYPHSAYEYLKSIGYKMDVDPKRAKQSLELLTEDIVLTFAKRKEAILHFLKEEQWDLFIGTITETDRLHHFLWNAIEDREHKFHGFFINLYRDIDTLIGEISAFTGDMPFLIVSDHGFTSVKQEVYINYWLKENGYIKFTKYPSTSLEAITTGTKAFALDPARIYINLKGKYARGYIDSEKEYAELRASIQKRLLDLKIHGEPVARDVFMKEELYFGPYAEKAPDLVVVGKPGYDFKSYLNKTSLYGKGIFTGAHTQDNATFFINRPIEAKKINIVDVAPTVLKLMEIEHEFFDGRPVY